MATKNLARTIIEGGRARYNQWDRNHSHRQERAATRAFLTKGGAIHEGFDELPAPRRDKVPKGFSDKLGAPRRWLRSQVGRPWDKVHAEIFARFDPRTLAGRHIIFDHLLLEVTVHSENVPRFWQRQELYVDRHGILQHRTQRREHRSFRWTKLPDTVQAWANGRRVATVGHMLFWLEEAGACETCHASTRAPCCCPVVDDTPAHGPHRHYRQAGPLNHEDAERWRSLEASVQALLRGPRRSETR